MNNHAESIGQCPKRGHMLQVMAPNHVRGGAPNLGWKIGSNLRGEIGSNLRPWTLPNCGRGLRNQGFRILRKSGNFGPQFGSIWGAMGSKIASIWRLRSHVKSRAVATSLHETSGRSENGGGAHGRSNRPQGRRTTGGGQGSQTPG